MQSSAPRALILASTSRYRQTLLQRLQLPFSVQAPGVDETPMAGEPPAALASRLALAKASAVAAAAPHAVVIGCDQVADLRGQALGKRGAIHAGAAADDGQPPCCMGFFHGLERRIAPPGHRCGLGGFAHAVKHMRRAGSVLWAWAGGDDAEFPIELHAIGIDDGPTQVFRDGQREGGFTRRSRPHDKQG